MTDAQILTRKLIAAGADRAKVIAIIDSYGDSIDWSYHSLDSIIGEVWNSDLNSGNYPENYIINEICRAFNVNEVDIPLEITYIDTPAEPTLHIYPTKSIIKFD